jgi:urease accessory protein
MHSLSMILFGLLGAASPAALAHPGDVAGGLAHGFAHPFQGLDHMLAMVIVGIWAVRTAQRPWLLPTVFVTFMAIGALGSLPLPFVEPMVTLSVLVFGLAGILARRLPLWIGGLLVAVFAVSHGHAHFSEMPDTSTAGFAAGMLAATALLHCAGILIGLRLLPARQAIRAA